MTSKEILQRHEDLYRKECETRSYNKGWTEAFDYKMLMWFMLTVSMSANLVLGIVLWM